MRHFVLGHIAMTSMLTALLSGCGGSPLPGAAPGVVVKAHRVDASPELLYAFNATPYNNDYVYVVSWPQGRILDELGPFFAINGICTDGKANVFVLHWGVKGYITEYAHGRVKPIRSLQQRQRYPTGCAVDPITGDLAVTNVASVTIYRPHNRYPVPFTDPRIAVYDNDAYDSEGNLFVDGHSKNHAPVLAELAKGSNAFTIIKLSASIGKALTTLQWVNDELAVSTQFGHEIYQVNISGSRGTVVGSTSLGKCRPINTYIFRRTAISNCGALTVFKYPRGAPPIKIYPGLGAPQGLVGLVISKEPSRRR